ncbi:hypothetical protein L484_005864 [Morus notabilis]|uniref:Uncharacterized protein n=1 Tax=Morus notabilis TaxID=981085 RepID=W9RTB6_9ROSA|nr:hypothetical protein L484_005864 [Morus notabilis]
MNLRVSKQKVTRRVARARRSVSLSMKFICAVCFGWAGRRSELEEEQLMQAFDAPSCGLKSRTRFKLSGEGMEV